MSAGGDESRAPWTAEWSVDAELARRVLEAQFPSLAPVTLAPFGVGWDNTAYLVNRAIVVRFPRRAVAVPLLETEGKLLPRLGPRLPLPVPAPTLWGCPSDEVRTPWPLSLLFLGYPLLPGQTACRAALDDGGRVRLAPAIGGFLRALHAIPVEEAIAWGAGPDTIGRADVGLRAPRARAELARLSDAELPAARPALAAVIDDAAAAPVAERRALLHGDLYARHLLVDADGPRLCGVIDWGDVHVGHPGVDLAIACGFLPPAARDAFVEAYGQEPDADTWRLARLRAVYHGFAVLRYGRASGDADLAREGATAVRNATAFR
jgi:aminoglycoside phosphotransferase (APT) family kinase protein